MSAVIPIGFDPDVWIRIPLRWESEQWSGPEEWAAWVAEEASRGRADSEELAAAMREHALQLATFDLENVGARFWHFPLEGDPTGWVDVFIQAREDDGTPAIELLPPLPYTLADPAVTPLEGTSYDSAIRRLYLVPLDERVLGEDRTGLLARGEWVGVVAGWVVMFETGDADPAALAARLGAIDELFAGVDLDELRSLARVGSAPH